MSDEYKETKGQDVPLESILEVARQTAAGAAEAEAVAWQDLIEVPASTMTEENFAGRVGERFELELGHHDVQVELKEVASLGEVPDLGEGAPAARAPFSLLFKGHSPRALLPEGMYRLRHEEMGELEIHLRPAQRESATAQLPNTPHLEAIFN